MGFYIISGKQITIKLYTFTNILLTKTSFMLNKNVIPSLLIFFIFLISITSVSGQRSLTVEKTISGGLMKYYISLPKGWKKDKKWPVIIAVEAAEKEFKLNAVRFSEAAALTPYIIVSPVIVSNGNSGRRNAVVYPYSTETWDKIDAMSDCVFDIEGVKQIIKDVAKDYNGEEKVYFTGFEAGTHLAWTFTFKYPEILNGVAIVAGNFKGRCVDTGAISGNSARITLPIHNIIGSKDGFYGKQGRNYYQWENAKQLAKDHGYQNITEVIIQDAEHTSLPKNVVEYFETLRKK